MNAKRFMAASLAAVAVMVSVEFVVHGVLLRGLYERTADLWRPLPEIKGMMWIMWIVYFVMAPLVVWIYGRGYETGKSGLAQGFRYGLTLGVLFATPMAFGSFAVMPLPLALASGWFLGSLLEFVLMGMAVGMIYKGQ